MPREHSELGGPDRSFEWVRAPVEGAASMDTAGREHWEVAMGTLASGGPGADTSASAWGWSLWKSFVRQTDGKDTPSERLLWFSLE